MRENPGPLDAASRCGGCSSAIIDESRRLERLARTAEREAGRETKMENE